MSYAILARWPSIGGPDRTAEMQDLVRELRGIAIQGNDRERLADSLWFTLIDVTTSGATATDIHGVIDEYGRLARELRQQSLQWYHGGMQTIHALAEGRLADAEALLEETRRRGQRTQTWDADVSYRLGLFTLRREQGRLDETVDVMIDAAERFRGYPMFQSLAAFTLGSVGRHVDAGAALDAIARDDFAVLPRDLGWLYGMVLALDTAALLGDRDRAVEAERLLEPYAGRFAIASGEEHAGPVDRVLGLAAALDGHIDEAIVRLETAAQLACDAGVSVWERRASVEAAALLLRRDGPGDRALALDLASSAATWARTMGCPVIEAHARGLLEITGRGTGRAHASGRGGGQEPSHPVPSRRRRLGSGGRSGRPDPGHEGDAVSRRAARAARTRVPCARPRRRRDGGPRDAGRAGAGLQMGRCRRAPRRRGKGRLPGADRRAARADRPGGAGRHGRHGRTGARRARGNRGRALRRLRPRWTRPSNCVGCRARPTERQQGRDRGHHAHCPPKTRRWACTSSAPFGRGASASMTRSPARRPRGCQFRFHRGTPPIGLGSSRAPTTGVHAFRVEAADQTAREV